MPAKTTRTGIALFSALLLGVATVVMIGSGACKKESRTAGKEARQAYEKSKELLKDGLDKTKDVTKEGLEKGGEVAKEGVDQTKAAAEAFSKGWKEGAER